MARYAGGGGALSGQFQPVLQLKIYFRASAN
jgi:hypothetical protein